MPLSSPGHLLPIVVAYLPVPIAGAVLSARWKVGASPDGGPGDMFLRGTALTPPLFLPAILVSAGALAPREGAEGRVAAGVVSAIAVAFLAGSTANLPNDFKAADAAGTPRQLTAALAAVHLALGVALLAHSVPRLRSSRPSVKGFTSPTSFVSVRRGWRDGSDGGPEAAVPTV